MLLRRELINIGIEADTADEAIQLASRCFVDAGFALPSFPQAVCDRELVFPTGISRDEIPGAPFDVAMPHAEGRHVVTSSVGVSVVARPVDFRSMHDRDLVVRPRVLFVLGIAEPAKQIGVLQRVTRLVQEEGLLAACADCASADELFDLLSGRLGS